MSRSAPATLPWPGLRVREQRCAHRERAQMKLTDSQRKAIEHASGNLQLIACAGSGKTEVVARRVVHLLSPGAGGGLRLLPPRAPLRSGDAPPSDATR